MQVDVDIDKTLAKPDKERAIAMRKMYTIGLALVAVFAFDAVAASSAFAVSKFLLNGQEITSTIDALWTGELLLEDMGATGPPDILCSAILEGTIAAGGIKDEITSVLELSGELLAGALANSDLVECEDMNGLCERPVDVEAINLPWGTEVMLTTGGVYYDLIFGLANGLPGYAAHCKTLLGEMEDMCTGNTGASLTNETGSVLGEFLESNEEITPAGNCTIGGTKMLLVVGDELITSSSGSLSPSE